jgi:hypothetical protein
MAKLNKVAFGTVLIASILSFSLLVKGSLPFVPSGIWAAGPNMADARSGSAAAVLQDGTVLTSGGVGASGGPVATGDLLSTAGSVSSAAPMSVSRQKHTATTLKDGRVLVAGGSTSGGAITSSAEIYNPATNSWAIVAAGMSSGRSGHTATLLQDGRVLIVGGDSGSGPLSTLETFSPDTNTFTSLGLPILSAARKDHGAALLLTGKVLIAGGSNGSAALTGIDVFDPVGNTIAALSPMATARQGLSVTTLLKGQVLLAGGNNGSTDLASTEILDPAAGSIAPGPSMSTARTGHLALLLPNNNAVLMVSGSSSTASEIYVSWQNAFASFGTLAAARSNAAGAAAGQIGSATIAGGLVNGVASNTVETIHFPMVKTDKEDYQPGETAQITGSGFKPGEVVNLSVEEIPDLDADSPIPLVATADANGNISATLPIDSADANIRFYLTATGATSGFTAGKTFTDASKILTFNFTNAPFTVNLNACAGVFAVERRADGVLDTSGATDLNLSSSGAGTFYSNSTCTTAITTITILNGSSSAGFYYKPTSGTGTHTITATGVGGGGNYAGISTSQGLTVNSTITSTSLSVATASGPYGGTASLSATLTPAVSGKSISFKLNGTAVGAALTNASGVATVASASLAGINAGTYATGVQGNFAGDATYGASSGSNSLTVTKVDATIVVTPYHVTYNGSSRTATATATGVGGADLSAGVTLSGTTHTNAGDYPSDAWSFHDAGGNYNDATGTVSDSIAKANAIIVVTPYNITYDGVAHTATGTATGVLNESLTGLVLSGTTHTAGGTYASDAWTFTNANYNDASGTVSDSIAKANATIVVTPYNVTYNGVAHTATGTATGVLGESLSGLILSGTTHSAAGTYATDAWTFTDVTGNYNNASGTVSDSIAKANATIVVTPYSVTYDGVAHTATGTATGVLGESLSGLVVSGTTHTLAGTYAADPWTFTDVTGNYNNTSGTVSDSIAKATATIVVTPYNVTYNGAAHTATGTATGVFNESLTGLVLSGTTHTAAGTYASDAWTFTNANYNDAGGTVSDSIAKANATIVVTPYNVTYDGVAHTATGTATGVFNESLTGLVLSGTTHTAAGTYASDAWTFTNANYNDAGGTVSDSIAKANATIVVTPYNVTYNGLAHTATGTATGVLGESLSGLVLSGTTHTVVGTYAADPWTFTDVTGNYNNVSGSVSDSIAKANATIVVTPYSVTYDGAAHTATGTATGVLGESLSGLVVSGTTHTLAGTYAADPWTFTDLTGNYNNTSGTVSDSIAKATATIVVTPYNVTYNGAAHTATGTATGILGESLSGLVLSGTTHSAAGTYSLDPWTFTNANYHDASGTVSDSIAKANATIVVTPYNVTYNGLAHTATGTATGVFNESLTGLVLSGTTHTAAGTYAGDAWTFTNANYNDASGTVSDSIGKANATIVVTPYNVTYNGLAHTAAGTATGALGEALSGLVISGTTHTAAGTYLTDPWTFTDVTGNYNNASGSVSDSIAKANATILVIPYSVTYDGSPHTATGTAKGALNENLSGLVLSGTTHTAAGLYSSDSWSFTDVTGNYNNASGTVSDLIGKAATSVPTVTVTPNSQQYSDKVDLSAAIASNTPISGTVSFYINYNTGTAQLLGTVSGVPANSIANLTGVALLETVAGSMNPTTTAHLVTAVFLPGDIANFTGSLNSAPLTITQEDAELKYTGSMFAWTPANSTSVILPLSFSIKDITAVVDPLTDPNAGVITNARVKLKVGTTIICDDLVPVLVTAADTKVATVGCSYTFAVNPSDPSGTIYTVTAEVYNYYQPNLASDTAFDVTIAIPTATNFLTGGGYTVNTASAGLIAGTAGLKTNYGFNVKYNKAGTNLQGNANIIVRSGGKLYQIKSNSMQSLGATLTPTGGTATFITKCNVTDITNPLNPITMPGKLLTINVVDNGEPGKTDMIGIRVDDGSTLVFSNNWDSAAVKTANQTISGGNIVVH